MVSRQLAEAAGEADGAGAVNASERRAGLTSNIREPAANRTG